MTAPASSPRPARPTNRLLGSSLVVGSMTMLSRVMGLLRDVVIARFFGAGENADAFFVAFRIPQFLRRLFAEGAFAQAFIPVLAEYRNAREQTGDLATLTKLVRVAFLMPVVVCILLVLRMNLDNTSDAKAPGIPAFLIAFVVAKAANLFGRLIKTASRLLMESSNSLKSAKYLILLLAGLG